MLPKNLKVKKSKFKVTTYFNYYIHPAGHGYYFYFPSESPFIAAHLQVQYFMCLS